MLNRWFDYKTLLTKQRFTIQFHISLLLQHMKQLLLQALTLPPEDQLAFTFKTFKTLLINSSLKTSSDSWDIGDDHVPIGQYQQAINQMCICCWSCRRTLYFTNWEPKLPLLPHELLECVS